MVTQLWRFWKCLSCDNKFACSRTPRHAQVWCTGPDHEAMMTFDGERYL